MASQHKTIVSIAIAGLIIGNALLVKGIFFRPATGSLDYIHENYKAKKSLVIGSGIVILSMAAMIMEKKIFV